MNTNNRASHQFFDGLLKHILMLRQNGHQLTQNNDDFLNAMYSNGGGEGVALNEISYPSSIISNISSVPQIAPPSVTKIVISHNNENSMPVITSCQTTFPDNSLNDFNGQVVTSPKRNFDETVNSNDARANQMFGNSFIQYNSSFKVEETTEPQRKKSKPTQPNPELVENYNCCNTFVNHTMETYKNEQELKGNLPKRSRGRPRKNSNNTSPNFCK